MQRWCSKLRPLSLALQPPARLKISSFCNSDYARSLHSSPNLINKSTFPQFMPLMNALRAPRASISPLSHSFLQVRYITAKQKERKLKSRQPATPFVSKMKKYKIKFYSSFKGRFRVMNDGQIRRWKEGTRHNAHLKSKKARRRLRKPGTVPLAYAKVMKKLNFKA